MDTVSTWKGEDVEAAAEPHSPDRDPSAASDRYAAAFVWGIWGLMLLGNLALVLRYTGPFPNSDELDLLSEYIRGARMSVNASPAKVINQVTSPVTNRADTLWWLWQQHAEHRVPLAKLIWLGVLQ